MMCIRATIGALVALALGGLMAGPMPLFAAPPEPPAEDAPAEESPAQIRRWINQLDDDIYIVRERAMQNLMKLGNSVLEPVARAADDGNLETASRAVRILLHLSEAEDVEQAMQALHRIAALKNRPVERNAAESILQHQRERIAIAEIRRLGAVEERSFSLDGRPVIAQLRIGEDWKGGDEGLKHLKEIKTLQVLKVHGTPVGDKGIEHLKHMPDLAHIQLYGTAVTAPAVEALRKALPNADIHYRQGALLGVAGAPHAQGALITHVQPDSAAQAAGMLAGDVVVKFNGQKVGDFDGLTAYIGKCKPGDKATLEWIRVNETMKAEVTFGKWR